MFAPFCAGVDRDCAVTRGLRRLPMKHWLKLCVTAAFLLAAVKCFASFHLFKIEQIYSNADGTVQVVVMHESGWP
jgi:hypothetical protein